MLLRRKLAYSSGNFANTVCYQVFSNRVQFFYIDVLGLGAAVAGTIWLVFGLWNAVNDPLMGQVTDRTHSRWGRRLPYLVFGAVPLGLSFLLLWTPPRGGGVATAAWFLVTLFVFDTIFSLLIIAYNALFPELATDLRERASVAAWREAAAVVALILAFVVGPILSKSIGWLGMGAVIGAATALGYLVTVFSGRERPREAPEVPIGIGQSLRLCLASRPFRFYAVANICKEFVFLILAATLPFYTRYVLAVTGKGAADQEAVLLAVPFVLSIPLLAAWRPAATRLGPRTAWIAASVLFLPGLVVLALAGSFPVGLLGTSLLAPGLAGYMMLPIVLLSEVIDDDATHTGQRREGVFFGISSALAKLGWVVQGLLYAVVLPLTGYVANAAAQPSAAVVGIRLLMAGTPLIACLLAVVVLYRYPLRSHRAPAGVELPAAAGH